MTRHELWLTVCDLFLVNDGSLPEINFKSLETDRVSAAYEYLRRLAGCFNDNTNYWSLPEQRDMQVQSHDKVEDILAVAGAKYFHVVISDVYSPSGIGIPPLGISVFEDWISLDYRMGGDWNPDVLHGFFEIICALQNLTMAPEISHEENQNDPTGRRLVQALSDFQNS